MKMCSQNNLKYGLLRAFRTMVPNRLDVVILADRGFGRAQMALECQRLGFKYIIRVEPSAYIKAHSFSGKLSCLPIALGRQLVLHNVLYRNLKPVKQHVAIFWQASEDKP